MIAPYLIACIIPKKMQPDRANKPSIANIRRRLAPGDVSIDETTDAVKLYFREMGGITLLSREGEIEVAKEIEAGEQEILLALRAESLRLETVVKSMTGGSASGQRPFVSVSKKDASKKLSASSGFKGRSLALQRGGLIKPIAGRVVRKYGKYKVSGFSDYVFSKGLEFLGKEDSTIRVIADGRVMYDGRMPGYGQILIVDHVDRYYSLYGLLHKVLISAGDVVAKGEELALIGKPDAKGKNFYFEIRKNGKPVNPMSYL